jgi:bis(5'-nucleosyl)-tetraphosphatase (symmetrical)
MKTMALYLIGDIQGCDSALQRLLDKLDFSPSRDTLYPLGDLVNRGPESAAVLRRLMAFGDSACSILGNHDLHLLAVAQGARRPHRKDTLDGVLQASDRDAMLEWLIHQPLARALELQGHRLLLVHAGVLPQWSLDQTLALAQEVQIVLQGAQAGAFFHAMYGNEPPHWSDALEGMERLRVVVNALTRIRFCTSDGVMDFDTKEGADAAPPGFMPWFEVPARKTQSVGVAFGHWSTLGWLGRDNLYSLDTGCVWGGALSALRLDASGDPARHELLQVACAMAQKPGRTTAKRS